MSNVNTVPGTPNAQLIGQGASINPSSPTTTQDTGDTDTSQSLFQAGGSTRQTSFQDRAGTLSTALKGGSNVGNTVAADFGSWCQSRGAPANAASFAAFSQQYSAGLQGAGLSSADASTAISQGQAAIFSGRSVRNFTLGQGQV